MVGATGKKQLPLKIALLFATILCISMYVYVRYGNYVIVVDPIKGQERSFYKNGRSNVSELSRGISIVNPYVFQYLISQENICRKHQGNNNNNNNNSNSDSNKTLEHQQQQQQQPESIEHLFAIIYVHSAPKNFDKRLLIRTTWGNCSSSRYSCRLVFFLGLPEKDDDVKEAIRTEARLFRDVILVNFVDHYHNLTYKAIGAMKWISEFCSKARFIVKADDDMFVDTLKLFKILDSRYGGPLRRRILCHVWNMSPVLRSGRWKVDPEEMPREYYPRYCSGSAFILSSDLASEFYNVSKYVPFVWVDDAYLTGLLPEVMDDVIFEYLNNFYTFSERKSYNALMFVHTSKAALVRELWTKAVSLDSSER